MATGKGNREAPKERERPGEHDPHLQQVGFCGDDSRIQLQWSHCLVTTTELQPKVPRGMPQVKQVPGAALLPLIQD